MECAAKNIVTPSSHQVAHVDDNCSRNRSCGMESLGMRVLDLKATNRILENKGKRAVVRMSSSTSRALLFEKGGIDRRIREQPHIVELLVDLVIEEGFWKIETHGNGLHDLEMKLVTGLEEGKERGFEVWDI